MPQIEVSKEKLFDSIDVTTMLSGGTQSQIFSSKGEARKMIMGGGVSVNKTRVESPDQKPDDFQLLQSKYLLVQRGKKNYYLVIAV